jgi:glycosyltransferase involved in cell wall biosynthesis
MPIVATIHHAVHHPDARAYKGTIRAAYHRWWIAPNERRVLLRADRVVAVSRFVAKTARSTLADVPMQVIYNGVDTERFRPGTHRFDGNEPFRLLYIGAWKKLKGVDLLAPIMRRLGSGFELRYTGGGTGERDQAQLSSNMHDIGRLRGDDAVVAAMQNADALLFPSRSEGFGLVAAEAMACALPVIATQGSSLVELVENGVTGILCPEDDVERFAMAAQDLAQDHARRQNMSHAARRRATERFATVAAIDAYRSLYLAASR